MGINPFGGAAAALIASAALAPIGGAGPASHAAAAHPAAQRLSIPRAVGQTVMVHMDGTSPSRSFLRRVRRGKVGGVILLGDNVSSHLRTALAHLQRAARAGHNPPLLIAIDQEGGEVRRLDVPPRRSAQELGELPLRRIARAGWATGRALHGLGIDVDLAPDADVPVSSASFIARQRRAFGTGPGAVARRAGAFARGLRAGGVAATLKHFPGLGRLATSTDDAPGVVRASARELSRWDLVPFRRLVAKRRADLVMVGSAIYPALGSSRPALDARPIVTGLLRRRLGYHGVVITDSLDAAALGTVPHAPLSAARAGADILLFTGDEAGSAGAYRELRRAAHDHRADARRARRAAHRIIALKRRLARRRPSAG